MSNGLIALSHVINPCNYNGTSIFCIIRSQTAPYVSIINENSSFSVQIRNGNVVYDIRNPPQFMDLSNLEVCDAYYETS